MKKIWLSAILLTAIGMMFSFYGKTEAGSQAVPPLDLSMYEKVELKEGADFAYPADKLSDGKAKYFILDNGKAQIRFFLLKSSDEVVRAAFDSCDVCFRWKMGYYQQGDLMVCRRCGQTFLSVKINEIKGGCNPAPLDRKIVGKNVIITRKSIEEGTFYFR